MLLMCHVAVLALGRVGVGWVGVLSVVVGMTGEVGEGSKCCMESSREEVLFRVPVLV